MFSVNGEKGEGRINPLFVPWNQTDLNQGCKANIILSGGIDE